MPSEHPFPSFSLVLSQNQVQSQPSYIVFPWAPLVNQNPNTQPVPNLNINPVVQPHTQPTPSSPTKLKAFIAAIRQFFAKILAKFK
ncbi:hypothetical protein C8R43DRAFT_1135494 [Mycena crocata]|nr:hypothetical protein C8R43DRAFT_1135494 [Mycena crocata]